MDEPTHANESRFWDQVADWLIDAPGHAGEWPALPPPEVLPPDKPRPRDSHS